MEKFGVQYLLQGHFNTHTEGARDRTTFRLVDDPPFLLSHSCQSQYTATLTPFPLLPYAGNHTVEERRRGAEEHVSSGRHRLSAVRGFGRLGERAGAGRKGGERLEPRLQHLLFQDSSASASGSVGGTRQLYNIW